ncbi:uncharacterized protein LOC117787296 [Drosophila innubila]|uniref:uncharacterized protein LOC117787296 n=1 Tax=Drosophila innubila TaxID=198719 RepID=UPI00148C9318|nr:uncharacterized protein LOC117787296 [Drosophila innubila]
MLDDISALHISTARGTHNMDTTSDAIADACSLSSLESESDLSLALERELGEPADCDELPAFEIRAYSPHGRTPSPIDDLNVSDIETPKQEAPQQRSPGRQNNPDFVPLHEINAQISAPKDNADESIAGISRANSLETIFEGVFLHTPPRETLNKSANSGSNPNSASRSTPKRSRVNLMELVAMNRLHGGSGKENQSPCQERQDELT